MRKHVTFANVIALIALFVALGGTSYAVSKLNGKDLVDGSVTGSKLAKDTLTGKQIKEKKLGTVPLAANTERLLFSGKGGKGKKGAQRLSATGNDGPLVRLSTGQSADLISSGPFTIRAVCEQGTQAILPQLYLDTTEAGTVAANVGEVNPGAPESCSTLNPTS